MELVDPERALSVSCHNLSTVSRIRVRISSLLIVSAGKWDFRLCKLSLCNEAELLILLRIVSSPWRKTRKENESTNLYFTACRRKTHSVSLQIYMCSNVPLGTRWVPCSFQNIPEKHRGDMVADQNLFGDIFLQTFILCTFFQRLQQKDNNPRVRKHSLVFLLLTRLRFSKVTLYPLPSSRRSEGVNRNVVIVP